MTEVEWFSCTDPTPMLDLLRGKASDRKLRLFACACVRIGWSEMTDVRCRKAVETAEAFADGQSTKAALRRVRQEVSQAMNEMIRVVHLGYCISEAARRAATEKNVLNSVVQMRRTIEYSQMRGQASLLPVLLRCVFNPFRSVTIESSWLTWNDRTVSKLAQAIYDERAFDRLSVLADALEEAGCQDADMLAHCRHPGPHARGCWAVDSLLGKS
jgi:hypothetical protein